MSTESFGSKHHPENGEGDRMFLGSGVAPATPYEMKRTAKMYPTRCFFHWDGKGVIPIRPLMLVRLSNNKIEDVCQSCRIECPVRKAAYDGNVSHTNLAKMFLSGLDEEMIAPRHFIENS